MKAFVKSHLVTSLLVTLLTLLLAACQSATPALPTSTLTAAPTGTFTATALPSLTATVTPSPSPTLTETLAPSPTATQTPTLAPTVTPTSQYPLVTVKMQANCRYGPGTAYLYRWGLYPGDQADVRGRNWDGSWFWIHLFNLPPKQNCWASKIIFNETIDARLVHYVQIPLPHTTFAGPPGNVRATRSGNQVTVSWDPVVLSEDKRRGYMIEAEICENQLHYPRIIHTDDTTFTFRDDQDCKEKSGGLLYTAEKHGYSDPVRIPWP